MDCMLDCTCSRTVQPFGQPPVLHLSKTEARKGNKKRAESRVVGSASHVEETRREWRSGLWRPGSYEVKLYRTGDFEGRDVVAKCRVVARDCRLTCCRYERWRGRMLYRR